MLPSSDRSLRPSDGLAQAHSWFSRPKRSGNLTNGTPRHPTTSLLIFIDWHHQRPADSCPVVLKLVRESNPSNFTFANAQPNREKRICVRSSAVAGRIAWPTRDSDLEVKPVLCGKS